MISGSLDWRFPLTGINTIDGTNINYPVMQTPDNPDFYLKHAFDRSYSNYGTPYVQENCMVGNSDNLVLYGHHMNNGTMFADLCKYESEDFYREHTTIQFDTLEDYGEYSISVGVQTLADSLQAAQVDSPIDMERIKLALQGYNFGNGYISWAISNYGGYSYANAVEFSAMQAERLGWSGYGDIQYPNHVLRYYLYGRAFTAGGNEAIVEVALAQVGNEGGEPYWSWYDFDSRVEWCACFVSWCADQCGYLDSGIIPKFSGCSDGVSWLQCNGQWQDRSYEPQAGDIIFYDWYDENGQDGSADHVGIVQRTENGIVYTVQRILMLVKTQRNVATVLQYPAIAIMCRGIMHRLPMIHVTGKIHL